MHPAWARSGDARERLLDGEDGDALMLLEIKQVAVAGDDGIGTRGDGAGDDVIVVGIGEHDTRRG